MEPMKAKKSKSVKSEKIIALPTLAVSVRRRVADAVCDALNASSNTGNLVTPLCNIARDAMHGKPFPAADMESIVEDIANRRGWKKPTRRIRCSEVRAVLSSYRQLPEAVKIAQRDGTCNWLFALRLARIIRKDGSNAADAVKAARKAHKAKVIPIQGRIAALLKKFAEDRPRNVSIANIMEAANLLRVSLKLK
jgi:hypothetical protein